MMPISEGNALEVSGAEGKRAVLLAVERRGKGAGFMSAQVVDSISKETVKRFVDECIHPGETVRTDAYRAMNVIARRSFMKAVWRLVIMVWEIRTEKSKKISGSNWQSNQEGARDDKKKEKAL